MSGLIVASQILCNGITVLSLVVTINGLLTWIGRGFGIHQPTPQLVLRYIFYPITFFIGNVLSIPFDASCPHPFVAQACRALRSRSSQSSSRPNSSKTNLRRTWTCRRSLHLATRIHHRFICLLWFANLGSLWIQIGVFLTLAPSRTRLIARIGSSAMICGFISTSQAAGIACLYCHLSCDPGFEC